MKTRPLFLPVHSVSDTMALMDPTKGSPQARLSLAMGQALSGRALREPI
jgi:hypothetical protein